MRTVELSEVLDRRKHGVRLDMLAPDGSAHVPAEHKYAAHRLEQGQGSWAATSTEAAHCTMWPDRGTQTSSRW
jgi:hypothetical protein